MGKFIKAAFLVIMAGSALLHGNPVQLYTYTSKDGRLLVTQIPPSAMEGQDWTLVRGRVKLCVKPAPGAPSSTGPRVKTPKSHSTPPGPREGQPGWHPQALASLQP